MRALFSDGYNSMWHFIFGCVAVYLWFVTPLFFAYQLIERTQKNTLVDLSEFFIGYVATTLLTYKAP